MYRKRPPKGDGIEKRPPKIDARKTVGDWEMDTVYSSKAGEKDTLLVLAERKSRIPILELMPDRTKENVIAALDPYRTPVRSAPLPATVPTITVDNSGEFADVARSASDKGLLLPLIQQLRTGGATKTE